VSQRLLKAVDGGRVPAVEVLLNNNHMAELIEQGRISEIKEAMANSMAAGSQTFEEALIQLIQSGKVTKEDALANSDSPTNLLWLLENRTEQAPAAAAQAAAMPGIALPPALEPSPPDPRRPQPGGDPNHRIPATAEGASFSEFLLNI